MSSNRDKLNAPVGNSYKFEAELHLKWHKVF